MQSMRGGTHHRACGDKPVARLHRWLRAVIAKGMMGFMGLVSTKAGTQ